MKTVAILESNSSRVNAMVRAVRKPFPQLGVVVFDSPRLLFGWLSECWDDCRLLSLGEEALPPGDVLDLLLTRPPAFPVLLHSTDARGAPRMESALCEAGWRCSRVVPYDDLQWIREAWMDAVRDAFRLM